MKSIYLVASLCLWCTFSANAGTKYWVGPMNGNWSDPANWSNVQNGPGGADVPGTSDAAVFVYDTKSLVHVDISPTIHSLFIQGSVTLYASSPVLFKILSIFDVHFSATLKDSTTADVPFNFVFNGATGATGRMFGNWIFEGSVAVDRVAGNGAGFTVEPGSRVNIISRNNEVPGDDGGMVIFRRNTNFISSSAGSLRFFAGTKYILQENMDASIPDATWADSIDLNGNLKLPNPVIEINGKMDLLTHLATKPFYRDILINVPDQETDTRLGLPNGTITGGDLTIVTTNNRTISLLAATGPGSSVAVQLGARDGRGFSRPRGGSLNINTNTKVTMAGDKAGSPGNSYRLNVYNFNQSGGIFSLQDDNNFSGYCILGVSADLVQTGGIITTNSTTTSATAKFIVEMNGPLFYPAPFGTVYRTQRIYMSGGTIDNGSRNTTLRISQIDIPDAYFYPTREVVLQTPLQTGKLELIQGTLKASATNVLTVINPDPVAAVTVAVTGKGYINGPVRRWTNSTEPYSFPTGYGGLILAPHLDACLIVPASAAPSLYQAEYIKEAYGNLSVSAPLKGVSNAEYWQLTKISGEDATVKLIVNEVVPGATPSDALVAARYINGRWQTENGSVLTPGNSAAGTVTSKLLPDLGAFTFGYADPADLHEDTTVIPSAGGLDFKYYEGGYNTLPDFSTLTPVKTGNSANIDLGVRRAGVTDSFAIVWQGYINIPAAGTYTFETVSDDGSKVYFNSFYSPNATPLVDNDGTHPPASASGTVTVEAAGRYPIAITYMENYGGESMELYWSGPGIERQLVPDAVFAAEAPVGGNGLDYKYYEGGYNTLPDFSTLTPVKTGNSANIDLGVRRAGVTDSFAIVWQGYINIPAAGTYTFETVSDDGSKVYFNSFYSPTATPVVDNDGTHPPASASGTVTVAASGRYPIAITYMENYGGESMELYWSGPGIERQLVPDAAFSRDAGSSSLVTKVGAHGSTQMNEGMVMPEKEKVRISRIYPNPFSQSFNIDFYNTQGSNKISVGIYDLAGSLIYTHRAGYMAAGKAMLRINLPESRMTNGIYVVRLTINGIPSKTEKLVKVKSQR